MIEQKIKSLFKAHFGYEPLQMELLPASGSSRKYYILETKNKKILGAYNDDIRENEAFLNFTEHFLQCHLSVPAVFAVNDEKDAYLLEYLGDTTLFDFITQQKTTTEFPSSAIKYYHQVLDELPKFQVVAGRDLNYSFCYPRAAFDRQSIQWDLNYFKYYFLKLAGITFNEQKLENDFQELIEYLLQASSDFFLYRDFQSRNIIVNDNKVYFIDYQGGRKGALQYDIASLLWDAKADIPNEIRLQLLNHYLETLSNFIKVDKKSFTQYYYMFVLVRILQAMGAYGYRGFYEQKKHFLQSIPFALNNLNWLFDHVVFPIELPELFHCLQQLPQSEKIKGIIKKVEHQLVVRIFSFSYKKGFPKDASGNGGGHIFDCRALPNPGREERFKTKTGHDQEVKDFLNGDAAVERYFNNVKDIVFQSIENYTERGFENLMVSFGCTGGQHRSVYFAERMAAAVNQHFSVKVVLQHNEQTQLNG
ncbi:MAG: RNase adapter RapZ [Bacteroidales bacterium]|nr:RNase adapter RapZ [Bacteroidales bacterium]